METKNDDLTQALLEMQQNLKKVSDEHAERIWLQTGRNKLSERLRGDRTVQDVAKQVIDFLAGYLTAQLGALYIVEGNELVLQYAYGITGSIVDRYQFGEGLVGQTAAEGRLKVFDKLPKNYFKVESALGKEKPDTVVLVPATFDGRAIGVIELAKFEAFSPIQLKLLEEIAGPLAITFHTLASKKNLEGMVSQLKNKEQQLSTQLNAINRSNAAVEFDMSGNVISANDIFLDLMGYTENEIIGKHHSLFSEKGQALTKEYRQFWANLKKGDPQQNELKRIHKTGEFIWLKSNYSPIIDTTGNPTSVLEISVDITDNKKQQIEIEAVTKAIYDSNSAVEYDLEGNILRVNKIFLDLTGFKETEVVGKPHSMFIDKEYASGTQYHQFWSNLRNGVYQFGEYKIFSKTGEPIWLKGSYSPIRDEQGRIYKIFEISVDISLAMRQTLELSQQAEEMQTQQEELKQLNEELEEQTQNLKQQQEELQMTNEELEEQTQALEMKNKEVEAARDDIEQKSRQLEISSRYKSEFLANMSHELRTPLNSLLILSKDLASNKTNNLSEEQIESAEIIHKSGQDLLELINEILDLSKIEAGKMVLNIERIALNKFTADTERLFKPQAEAKGINFSVAIEKNVTDTIRTDRQRLDQVVKNLLSNAIKFTEKGSVNLVIAASGEDKIAIHVKDTGIGIAKEKQELIFEAFHQADGSTSRRYGGTGLGLSISRELVKLLEGEIGLISKPEEGSVFTITLPIELKLTDVTMPNAVSPSYITPVSLSSDSEFLNYPSITDDRKNLKPNDRIVLIVEDDLKFAEILRKQAQEKGFKTICCSTGEDALILTRRYKPQAIILDINLPGINGYQVMSEIKTSPDIRHIAIHIVSANEPIDEPRKEGAIEFLVKPITKDQLEGTFNRIEKFLNRKMKNLLLIEDNTNARKAIIKLIGSNDVQCFEAATGEEALTIFKQNHIDCIILDLGLPDVAGFDIIYKLEALDKGPMPPIIIYTGRELTKAENDELMRSAKTIIVKGVKSEERLLDETALFLHRTISNMPELQQKMIKDLYNKEDVFVGKKILLVDDDMRNVFALSKVLRDRNMEIIKAENGIVALDALAKNEIDMVLMDIMMPEMDGYETMHRIRAQQRYKKLPIIALTAKAMKDDKQKCIDAGANDYIAKPVDVDRLVSLMRVWLGK